MNRDFKKLLKKYREQINVGLVPYADIVISLRSQLDTFDYIEEDIPQLKMHLFNASHLPSNEIICLSENQLEVKAIGIRVDEKILPYIQKNYVPEKTKQSEEVIYLAYEDNVGYHYSNSNRLFLETRFAHGISERDFEEHTEELMSLLGHLKHYHEIYLSE